MESFFKTIFTYLINLIVLNIIKWDIIFKMYKSYMKENTQYYFNHTPNKFYYKNQKAYL